MSKHDSPGVREIVLVMGMTGWGKSWWSKLYSRIFTKKIVYDPTATFPVDNLNPETHMYDGTISELCEVVLNPEVKKFSVGFSNVEDIEQAASASFARGDNLLVLEELATVFDKGQARLPEWGKRHVFYGRHFNCSMLLIAQRPTYIPIDFRSQANRVITFCQHEGADMDWLVDFYGKERMSRMMTLPKFNCFDYHNGVVKEYSIVSPVQQVFGVTLDSSISHHVDLLM